MIKPSNASKKKGHSNVKNIVNKIRLPWVISNKLEILGNQLAYIKNNMFNIFFTAHAKRDIEKKITFYCGFHGKTGAVHAIANIANVLAKKYKVEFVTTPSSNFNSKLSHDVKLVKQINLDSDLFICDLSCDEAIYKLIKSKNKKILLSVHGMLHSEYGLREKEKMDAIAYADYVQFVSDFQRSEYKITKKETFVIPNIVERIRKHKFTKNVGVVGNLDLKNKNVEASVEIFLGSKAKSIHLWSVSSDKWDNSRVICHEWESNKSKIYNSFDVLVFMSQEETQSLGILEAMSAGIPCLLSNIPVFDQFSDCNGVFSVNPNDLKTASKMLSDIIDKKQDLSEQIKLHWESNYSEDAVSEIWYKSISRII